MSIEQPQIVDGIGVDKKTGELILVITDHINWDDDAHEHLILLQGKINTYLSFIESGELLETYPDSRGRNIVIKVVGQYPLGDVGSKFFTQASSVIADTGVKIKFQLFKGNV